MPKTWLPWFLAAVLIFTYCAAAQDIIVPSDPQIRRLVSEASGSTRDEAENLLKSAVALCTKQNLKRDCAIAEAALSVRLLQRGALGDASNVAQDALHLAEETGDLALQAELLLQASTTSTVDANTQELCRITGLAVERARQSKNLYVISRALGEEARCQTAAMQYDAAEKLLSEALHIDRLNGYSLESVHLLYHAQILRSTKQASKRCEDEIAQAYNKAVDQRNYWIVAFAAQALADFYNSDSRPADALRIAHSTLNGEFVLGKSGDRKELLNQVSLPVIRALLMNTLATAQTAMGETDAAIQTWSTITELGETVHSPELEAGSVVEIAKLQRRNNDYDAAIHSYEYAAKLWETANYKGQLRDTLLDLCSLLIQHVANDNGTAALLASSSEKLLPLLSEGPAATRLSTFLNLAVAHAQLKQYDQSEKALLDADRLLILSDARSVTDQQRILFFRLAGGIYAKESKPTPATVKFLEAAIVARRDNDNSDYQEALNSVLNLDQIANFKERYSHHKAQEPVQAIIEGQILLHLATFDPQNHSGSSVPLAEIAELIYKVVRRPDGAKELTQVLIASGEAGYFIQRVGWPALMRHYISVTDFTNAVDAGTIATALASGSGKVLEPDIEDRCLYAYALAASGDRKKALTEFDQCTNAASAAFATDQRLQELIAVVRLPILETAAPEKAIAALREILKSQTEAIEVKRSLARTLALQGNTQDAITTWKTILDSRGSDIELSLEAADSIIWSDKPDSNAAAREFLEKAIGQAKSDTPHTTLLRAYYGLAQLSLRARKPDEALRNVKRARSLNDSRNPEWDARLTSLTGDILETQRDAKYALSTREEARQLFLEANDFSSAIREAEKIATTYQDLGRISDSVHLLINAKELADKTNVEVNRYWVRIFLAEAIEKAGNYIIAVRLYKEAESIAIVQNDSLQMQNASLNLAWGYLFLGEWNTADEQAKRALVLANTNNDDRQKARALLALISIYGDRRSELKNIDTAFSYVSQLRQLPVAKEYTTALNDNLAELYWSSGKFDLAESAARSAAAQYKRDKNKYSLAHALLSAADAELRGGHIAAARATLLELKHDAGDVKDLYTVARTLYTTARIECSAGDAGSTTRDFDRLFHIMERFKEAAQGTTERAQFSNTYDFVYDDAINCYGQLYLHKGDPALALRALNVSEQNRAKEFSEQWGAVFSDSLRSHLSSRLQDKESELHVRRQQLIAEIIHGTNADETQRKVTELESIDAAQSELEREVWAVAPEYAAVKYPRLIDLRDIQLNSGEILLITKLSSEKAFVWIFEKQDSRATVLQFYEVLRPMKWFEDKVKTIRDSFNGGVPDVIPAEALADLYEALFPKESVRNSIIGARRLLIVPDNVLTLVPFEALAATARGDDFPLANTPIAYFPSVLSFEAARLGKPAASWAKSLFAVGDPIVTGPAVTKDDALISRGLSLDRIPATAEEVRGIAKDFAASDTKVLLGEDAKKDTVRDMDLSQFRYLHFATHGLLPTDSGLVEPALVFSGPSDHPKEIMLLMSEILTLKMRADLVVLSACNTGSGRVSKAEGVANLGRAFMSAGSTSAVVSLWQVADDSTAIFMDQLYTNLKDGMLKPEALAAARKTLRSKGYASPFYWAPFVLLGD